MAGTEIILHWSISYVISHKKIEILFTQVTLEGRGGALSSMHSFLLNCPELVNEDIIRRLLTPIESAISMLIK